MDFINTIRERAFMIDKELSEYFSTERYTYPEIIYDAMKYSVFAGGKRIRPIMLLGAYEAFSGKLSAAVPYACALEMIHTYSLIHDDLPAMDNDDFRRGKPTCHVAFGESIAILAGDGLLNLAYEIMLEASLKLSDARTGLKAMEAIAKGAGVRGMIGGQVADVINEGKELDKEILEFIHKNKTAAMIQGALKSGGILGGADEKQIETLDKIGEKIGLAFQIQDDVLDVLSSFEVLGKPIGSDEKNEKITYVTLFGIEESQRLIEKLSEEAIELIKSLEINGSFLIDLTNYLVKRIN